MRPLDEHSPVPLHAQIAESLRLMIARGELCAGDRLPTVRQLAVDLRVNSNTVARVFGELEREGVVVTRRGAGTFVAERPPREGVGAVRQRRLDSLCRAFVVDCSEEGFSLAEVRRALRRLASPQENGP